MVIDAQGQHPARRDPGRGGGVPDRAGSGAAPADAPEGPPATPGSRRSGAGTRWLRWLAPVGAAGALAILTTAVVALAPGPFRRETLGRALAVEVIAVLLAALNYSGFLWGRRTFFELVTAQPQPPPEELARRDVLFVQMILGGATLFALWLWLGG